MSEFETCFFCGCTVTSGGYQRDHFPIPKRHGGENTVVACTACHDMKDRVDVNKWGEQWISNIAEEFNFLGRETRILLAKYICVILDAKSILTSRVFADEYAIDAKQLAGILSDLPEGSTISPNKYGLLTVRTRDSTEIGYIATDENGTHFLQEYR